MLCTRCWTEFESEARVCPRCGAGLRQTADRSGKAPRPHGRSARWVSAGLIVFAIGSGIAFYVVGASLYRAGSLSSTARVSRSPTGEDASPSGETLFPGAPPRALEKGPHSMEPGIAALNEEGVKLFNQGRYAEALERFRVGLANRPEDPVLKKNAAYALGNMGWRELEASRPETALEKFHAAAAARPDEPFFYFGEGLAHHRLGDDDRAVEAIRRGLLLEPDQPDGLKLLGEIAYLRDDLDGAIDAWQRALLRHPHDPPLEDKISKAAQERAAQANFQRRAAGHFVVKFEGEERRDAAEEVLSNLEDAYRDVGTELAVFPSEPVTVILYSSRQFQDVTRTPGWAGGIFDGKIRLPIGGAGRDRSVLRRVLFHEYTHAVVHGMAGRNVPTWLNEGLAVLFEGEGERSADESALRAALGGESRIPLRQLEASFLTFEPSAARKAYAESVSAVRYMVDRYGIFRVRELLEAMGRGKSFEAALSGILNVSYGEFEDAWVRSIS